MAATLRTPAFLTRLGLDMAADERAIRRAYAREVRLIDPELQPAEFQALREAYDRATAWLKWRQARPERLEILSGPEEGTPAPNVPVAATPFPEALPEVTVIGTEEATALFASFIVRLLRDDPGGLDEQVCATGLAEQLADPRLISLDARTAFEQACAEYLAAGWKPGNDVLFRAAIRAFQWDAGRNGLSHFGGAGFRLNQAITEWEIVMRRAAQGATRDMELLLRMRDETPPSPEEALYFTGMLPQMLRQFPNLLPIMSNMANSAPWEVPLTFSPLRTPISAPPAGGGTYAPPSPYINPPGSLSLRNPPHKPPASGKPGKSPVGMILVALLVLAGLFIRVVTMLPDSSEPSDPPAETAQPSAHDMQFKPVNIPIRLPTAGDGGFHPLLQADQAAALTARIRPNIVFDKRRIPAASRTAQVRYLIAVDADGLPTATVLETSSGSPEFDAAMGHAIAASGPYPNALISRSVPVVYAISPDALDATHHEH